MSKDLNELRERIIKHVPNILELKFGDRAYSHCPKDIKDLNLEDVLLCLQDSLIPMGDYSIDSGYLNFYKIESDEPEIEWSWKLGLSLDQQDPKVWSELLKIIK